MAPDTGDRTPRDVTFSDLAAPLSEKSAEAARKMTETQGLLREDPDFTDARWWLAEERGEVQSIADAIVKLRDRYTDDGVVDVLAFAEYCWRQHVQTNEWRSDATGRVERLAKGEHHGYHVVLRTLRSETGIEYGDYGDTEEIAT